MMMYAAAVLAFSFGVGEITMKPQGAPTAPFFEGPEWIGAARAVLVVRGLERNQSD